MITVKLIKDWREYAKDSRLPCDPDFAVQLVNLGIAEILDPAILAQLQERGKLPKPGAPPRQAEPKPEIVKQKTETFTPKTYRRKQRT